MNTLHDMGGMQGYNLPFDSVRDQNPFHARWEPLPYVIAILAKHNNWWSFDGGRYSIERLPARQYMEMPYFERVLTGMASLLVERGIITAEELAGSVQGHYPLSIPQIYSQEPAVDKPDLNIGDRVNVVATNTLAHVRAPAFTHGKTGVIIGIAPKAAFPGKVAATNDAVEEHSFHVKFEGKDLWPDAAEETKVVVDLFHSYLVKAEPEAHV